MAVSRVSKAKSISGLTLLAFALAGGCAAQTIQQFNTRSAFAAAAGNVTTIDFTTAVSKPNGSYNAYSSPPGVTLSGVTFNTFVPGTVYAISQNYCCPTYARGYDQLDDGSLGFAVTLPAQTYSFGFDVFNVVSGDSAGTTTVTINVTIGTQTFTVQTQPAPQTAFIGLVSSTPIQGFTITTESAQIDIINFAFGPTGSTPTPPPPTPPPATCTFTVTPTSQSFTAQGGSGTVTLTASAPTCAYTATANSPFLAITSGASGTGSGVVTYTAAPNTDFSSRAGTLQVAGQTVTVTENGVPESLSTSPALLSFTTAGSMPAAQTIAINANGPPLAFQVSATSGFIVLNSQSGTTPGTVSVTVNPAGLAPGSYSGAIVISASGANSVSVPVLLTVQPPLSVSTGLAGTAGTLTELGASSNYSASIPLLANFAGSAFQASVSGPGKNSVSPGTGTLPAMLQISEDATGLASGNYQLMLTITIPDANPSTVTIPLAFTVNAAQANQLQVDASGLTLSVSQSSPSVSRQIDVRNAGTAAMAFQVTADQPFIQVTPSSGTTTTTGGVPVNIQLNLAGYGPGTYNGNVTITSGSSTVTVPVHAAVTAQANAPVLSQNGLTFMGIAGGPPPQPQTLQVLSSGASDFDFQVTSSTTSGGPSWLSVTPTAGHSGASGTIQVSVNPATLSAGSYYALIQITSAGNPTKSLTVVFNVLPAATHLQETLQPTGLIFSTTAGAANPPSQNITITNPNTTAAHFVSAPFYTNGGSWFVYTPTVGDIPPGGNVVINVQTVVQNFARTLGAGVYQGQIAFRFEDGSVRSVDLVLVIGGSASVSANREKFHADASSSCVARKLYPVFTMLGNGFTVPASWPESIEVRVVDDCGNALITGSVNATFSNGDPPLALSSLKDGRWAATWVARNVSANTTITSSAQTSATAGAPAISGVAMISGSARANPQVPVVASGGVLNAASFVVGSTLAPGALVSVFGTALASQTASATTVPLPLQLANTNLIIGGQTVPLEFTSTGQVNAVLPFGLAPNSTQEVIVQSAGALSTPEEITISSAEPAIFTADGSGKGQGIVVGVPGDGTQNLADSQHPVTAGEVVVIYATGLGPVSPAVPDGMAAGSSPLSTVTDPLTVRIGGVTAQVLFAGLAPGFVGLYQINAVVPQIVAGTAPVVITIDGQDSPPVTIQVK